MAQTPSIGAPVGGPYTGKTIDKLFWIDLEMTGLDVNKEVIIECAVIITDLDFKAIDTYETVVQQPQIYLDKMDNWNREHHGNSGLTAKVPYGTAPAEVEATLIRLAKQHWPKADEKPMLAGNSIAQDRLFLDKYFPAFAGMLHYRTLDVSSWKIMFNNKFKLKYDKKNSHRALDDIRESIEELKYYLGFIKPKD